MIIYQYTLHSTFFLSIYLFIQSLKIIVTKLFWASQTFFPNNGIIKWNTLAFLDKNHRKSTVEDYLNQFFKILFPELSGFLLEVESDRNQPAML